MYQKHPLVVVDVNVLLLVVVSVDTTTSSHARSPSSSLPSIMNTTDPTLSRVAARRTAISGTIPILTSVVYEPVIPCQPAFQDW